MYLISCCCLSCKAPQSIVVRDLFSISLLPLMGAVELFFLPTQNNSCIAKVDFFLPSWRPALWDSSLSSLPSGVTPQSPASWHGSHFPLLSCFLYPGQMLRCPLLCALNRFQHTFQQFNPPLYSFCKENDRAMRKSLAEFQRVQVWQHSWVINRGEGKIRFVYLWWLFLYYLLGMT